MDADARADGQLMADALEDPGAFGAVYDRHAGRLLAFLTRRAGREVAEPLLGELFRIAFERRASFDAGQPSARPWLYGIASNLLLKHRRGEARRLRAMARQLDCQAERPGERETLAAVDARARFARVADAIEALPPGERDTLLLHVWEELSYQDVADALEIPVGTVRSRLNRARKRLRAATNPEEAER